MKDLIVSLRRVPLVFYILSTLIGVVFVLLSTAYFGDDPKDNMSMIMYMIKGDNSLTAIYMWHNVLTSGNMNTWLLILTPLICCVPYAYTFCIDMNSRCYIFSFNRQGMRRAVLSRFIGAGIFSAVIMLFALMISFFIALFYSGRLGSYSESPVSEMLIHRHSTVTALAEVCITYCCYAFFIGIICITLAAFISNAFTSCSALVLVLFMMGDVQSSYSSKFLKKFFSGQASHDDYNHFTDFLFVGNLSHGMPDFEQEFHAPYWIYILVCLAVVVMIYALFRTIVKRKVIL